MQWFFSFLSFSKQDILAYDSSEVDRIVIINENVVYNIDDDEYYIFYNEEEKDMFLIALESRKGESEITTFACLPGDPGYPHCGNTIVSYTTEVIGSTRRTSYIQSQNYLLGNNGWAYGGMTCGLTVGVSYGVNFILTDYLNASVSFNINGSYSFFVPEGYKGNIKYQGKFDVTPKRYVYKWSDGSITYQNFYSAKFVDGTGGFVKILVLA